MRGKTYTIKDKNRVKKLILERKSYKEIEMILDVPKSTISTWFGKKIDKPWQKKTMLDHLAKIRILARAALKNKWDKKRKEEDQLIGARAEKDIKSYPFKNGGFYKSLLSMLYWAEGSKHSQMSGTKFANTDPDLLLLYVTLLRKCYKIDENKLRIGLYVHYYHSIKKVKNFWSKTLKIPVSRFHKVYIKKRSTTKKYRKNFAGVCFLYYGDSKIRKELIKLGSLLKDTIVNMRP